MKELFEQHSFFFLNFGYGLVLFVAGLFMKFKPPKSINSFYGYRTPRSMSSQKKWDIAQQYSTNLMLIIALFLSLFGLLDFILPISFKWGVGVSTGLLVLSIIILLVATEKQLS